MQGETERGQRSRSQTGPARTDSIVSLVPKQDKPGMEETEGNLQHFREAWSVLEDFPSLRYGTESHKEPYGDAQ